MEELKDKYIPIHLDDAIIRAVNDDGEERLRLAVKAKGHDVLIRFPSGKDWDLYVRDVSELLIMLSKTAGDIEIDQSQINPDDFQNWAVLLSVTLRFKPCRSLVEKIFFSYLHPEVPGLETDNLQDWIMSNLGFDQIYYFFTSIFLIEEWIKKKSVQILQKTVQKLIPQRSRAMSQGSSTSESLNSEPGPAYAFD